MSKPQSRDSRRRAGRHVGGVAADEAGLSGHRARARRRGRRHGPDDQGRRLLRVDFGPHTFHIRETAESKEILKTITPFFGEDPLTLVRGTRVLLRGKEYVYPLEMLQVLFGVSPLLSARILFDYLHGDDQVARCAAEEGRLVRGVGRPQSRPHALRPVLRHLLGARVGPADRARFRRSRRSASPS